MSYTVHTVSHPRPLLEVAAIFLRLGCFSFGGPIAHLGYFRAELIERRRWTSDAHFADLVALCQFLPGPASSQLVFALGRHRAGLLGGLLASLAFTLPSALLMIAFAYGVASLDLTQAGWLHGLKVAAVAVVAQAVWGMGTRLCPDRTRQAMAVLAAAALLVSPGSLMQLAVIALGGLAGLWLYRSRSEPTGHTDHDVRGAIVALSVFAVLLVILPALVATTPSRELALFDAFYRSGSLVFGGGHVVLPLLHAEVVPTGWLTEAQFLAGYGAAQAVPGPLFTFAAYLGTAMDPTSWARGLWTLFAIFLPAWLLIGGALPFWDRLRAKVWAQGAMSGANAAVVGVLLAALYDPVFTTAINGPRDLAAALVALLLLLDGRAPTWLVVALCAAAGEWLL